MTFLFFHEKDDFYTCERKENIGKSSYRLLEVTLFSFLFYKKL